MTDILSGSTKPSRCKSFILGLHEVLMRDRGLRSLSVKLDEHVGHKVMVTGSAHRESKAQEKAEEKKEMSWPRNDNFKTSR